jgi:hypothetical protein
MVNISQQNQANVASSEGFSKGKKRVQSQTEIEAVYTMPDHLLFG